MSLRSTTSEPAELVLDAVPDAPTAARHYVRDALADLSPDTLEAAQLIVTELVANAYLHGAPPIVVRLARSGGRVRLEVADAGHLLPLRARPSPESTTGRGLALVAQLSSAWGVDPGASGGKVVWVELGEGSNGEPFPNDPRLEVPSELSTLVRDESVPRYVVRLGAVPTELLIEAKAHMDNVVRELLLMQAAQSITGVELPAPMAELASVATREFVEARAEIKRQALAAAERGESVTELELHLPIAAAGAGERYLAALDQADRYARAARLLTLAPPHSHRLFREWYVRALVEQLRAAATGRPTPAPRPFPQLLAEEADRLSVLQVVWHRLQLLQKVTAELTGTRSVQEMAEVVTRAAGQHPGVVSSRVYVLTGEHTLRSLAFSGEPFEERCYEEFLLGDDLPAAVVARTGVPESLRSLGEIYERFPALDGYYPDERSLHVVPLVVEGRVIGVFSLTFVGGEINDDAQVAFVHAVGNVLSHALGRARAAERTETERKRRLMLLTAQLDVLTGIVGGQPLVDALGSLLSAVEGVSADGVLASVLLLSEDGLHLQHGSAPSIPGFYNTAIDGVAIGPAVGSCGTAAYRRERVIVEDIATDALWADYRELAASAGLRACWSTPIFGSRGQLLGTFAMYYRQPQRPAPADLALVDVLVRTVGTAIERSRADQAREQAIAAEREAALVLQESLVPAVPSSLGPVALEARYRAGDPGVQVGGDWFDAVDGPNGTVLVVGDVQGHDLNAAAVMGQLRTVARAAAGDGQSPGAILASINRYLERLGSGLLATAVVVRLEDDRGTATMASAGHLPPVLLRKAESGAWRAEEVVAETGLPLSIGDSWPESATVLPADSVLLLYTDGLVETRAWALDEGLGMLRSVLEALPPDAGLTEVLDAALELLPRGSRGDDVAILAASRSAVPAVTV